MITILKLQIPGYEYFDDESNRFILVDGGTFRFEHSLKAISEWEATFKKPFLKNDHKEPHEVIAYYTFMCLDDGFEPEMITEELADILTEYMQDERTATKVKPSKKGKRNGQYLTSELIYAYMANAQIPFEAENWNINRLMTLLGVIGELNSDSKSMSKKDVREQNRKLNEERKRKLKTKG